MFSALMVVFFSASAQDFNYNFSKSASQYVSLIDSNSVVANELWSNNQVSIPTGFNMNVAGSLFSSVKLTTNGILMFDTEQKINFAALSKNFYGEVSSEGIEASAILYQNITVNDDSILKIEFRNVAFNDINSNKTNVSFQIWLKKASHSIEFHMGPESNLNSSEGCTIGLINIFNTKDFPLGFMIGGSSSNPSSSAIPANGTPLTLTNFPSENTVYSFTYSN
jgi:hypothetical protein